MLSFYNIPKELGDDQWSPDARLSIIDLVNFDR